MAAFTENDSEINFPLDSLDTRSCVNVIRLLGAKVEEHREKNTESPNPIDKNGKKLVAWHVKGITPDKITFSKEELDVGNSGTTLFLSLAMAGLGKNPVTFIGDNQIKKRSAESLLRALSGLGIKVRSENMCVPITVQGPWKGGSVTLPCPTSQYLSAILLAAPLASNNTITEINVPFLNEKPYIEMTLSYLNTQEVSYEKAKDFSYFKIIGGTKYKPINGNVTGDFSSAAFPICAALISAKETVRLFGLNPLDTQGDKIIVDMLVQMGAKINWEKISETEWVLNISRSGNLKGRVFDLNSCPDLLPIMAVIGAYSNGETALINVAHARIKESDRISVMSEELKKLGIKAEERVDSLIIHGGEVQGGKVDGHGDHRIVMALAVAALGAKCPVEISGADAANVTYPNFLSLVSY